MMQKGFNTFQLKVIALVFMVLDHIHYTFSGIMDVPLWFTILGRIAAPLFIFATANGMRYTSNAKKYLLRLWIGFLFMNVGNQLINTYFPLPDDGIIINNIFGTLFVISLIIYSIQQISACKKENRPFVQYICLMLVPVFTSVLLLFTINNPDLNFITRALLFLVPNIMFCEGGIVLVALGVGLYLCNQNNKKITIFYLLLCALVFAMGYDSQAVVESLFLYNIQWYMVLALPFMLLYNKQKGRGMKYFFYVFYPAHIYLLTIIAYMLAK